MGDVVDIESVKPHLSGPAICTECEHEWYAVIVKDRDAELLECPSSVSYTHLTLPTKRIV